MAAAAILKNQKSAISPERFDRSSRNLVRWRILGLRMGQDVEIFNFWKSKMADGRHHKKSKKSPYLSPDLSDYDKIWHADAVRPSWASQPLKIWNLKVQSNGGRHLEKSKIGHISGTVQRIFAKFGIWRTVCLRTGVKISKFWKFKMADICHLKIENRP